MLVFRKILCTYTKWMIPRKIFIVHCGFCYNQIPKGLYKKHVSRKAVVLVSQTTLTKTWIAYKINYSVEVISPSAY